MHISINKDALFPDILQGIFIWGMPGVGKTTIGKKLAAKLDWAFSDLDARIEEEEAMLIDQIFAEQGESYFRKLEAETLRSASVDRSVISTGGGTPCFHQNADWMLTNGLCIFLEAPDAWVVSRLKQGETRPLFKEKQDLLSEVQGLRERRESYYRRAHWHIDARSIDLNELVSKVNELLENNPG